MRSALMEEVRGRYAPGSLYVLWPAASSETSSERFFRRVALRWEEAAEVFLAGLALLADDAPPPSDSEESITSTERQKKRGRLLPASSAGSFRPAGLGESSSEAHSTVSRADRLTSNFAPGRFPREAGFTGAAGMGDAPMAEGAVLRDAVPARRQPGLARITGAPVGEISEVKSEPEEEGNRDQGAQGRGEGPIRRRGKPSMASGAQEPFEGKASPLDREDAERDGEPPAPRPPALKRGGREALEDVFAPGGDGRASQSSKKLLGDGVEATEENLFSRGAQLRPLGSPIGSFVDFAALEAFLRDRKRREDVLREWEATGF